MSMSFADGRVRLMGILNVTPDSFSDGGLHLNEADAVRAAARMKQEGADVIDIGAESTRPGHIPVSAAEEIARLKSVVKKVVALGSPLSIDTTKAEVAAFALDSGAAIINDIWGLQGDPEMACLAAARNVPVIVMHNRTEANAAIDIMADMDAFFARSFAIAASAGLARDNIILDPGIGFGKTFEQNLVVLKNLESLGKHQLPVLVGASRKSFMGRIVKSEPQQRLPGTLATHLFAARNGATILRVHDVWETLQALRVQEAIAHA